MFLRFSEPKEHFFSLDYDVTMPTDIVVMGCLKSGNFQHGTQFKGDSIFTKPLLLMLILFQFVASKIYRKLDGFHTGIMVLGKGIVEGCTLGGSRELDAQLGDGLIRFAH